jgi:hypothetical protein
MLLRDGRRGPVDGLSITVAPALALLPGAGEMCTSTPVAPAQ